MNIRLSNLSNLDALMSMAKACAKDMADEGIYQWNEHYPSKEAFVEDISRNVRNQKFYEHRGYKRLGEIFFPLQSDHPFYCYEKILD